MNSKLLCFYNFFILFIFVYYFNELKQESQRSIQTSFSQDISRSPSILICVSLENSCDEKIISIGNFKKSKHKNETMKNLVCYLNKNIPLNPKLIIEEAEKWNFMDAFECEKKHTVKKKIILYDHHLCANYDLIINLIRRKKSFKIFFSNINSKVFLYPNGYLDSFLGLSLFTLNFDRNDKFISKILVKQVEIYNSSLEKKCMDKNYKAKHKVCSKIKCYQHCYKMKINSYRFLYTKDDDFNLKIDNSTYNPIDKRCFEKCLENFYGYYYYLGGTKFSEKNDKSVEFLFKLKTTKIVSKKLMTKEIFFLKITGLLSILLGFNYLDFFVHCLSEFKKIIKIKKANLIKKIKNFIFFFIVVSLTINCFCLIKTYKKFILIKTSTNLFPKTNIPFSISPCFNIKKIIDTKINSSSVYLEKINFLEKKTFNFNYLLNKSKVQFLTNAKKFSFKKKKIETFYMSESKSKNPVKVTYKCFFIKIYIRQSLIPNLLGGIYVKLNFNLPYSFYYLTDKNLHPNSGTTKLFHRSKYKIIENIFKNGETSFSCKKYAKKCFSQKECIDKCIVLKYLKIFKKLPLNIPIFTKWFKKPQYNILSFHNTNELKIEKIRYNCTRLFPLKDCYKKNFINSINDLKTNVTDKNKKITVFSHGPAKSNSRVIFMDKQELVSNILTSFSVWIGFSIPKLAKILFVEKKLFFLKNRLILSSKINKIFKIWFNIMLFIGFLYNLQLLKTETLKQSKITSVNYKFLSEIEFPFITICLNFKKKLNLSEYSNLSGNLLDQITFSANDVFESVKYFDENLKIHTQFDLNELELNNTNKLLKLTHFYFMELKCYKWKYKVKISFYKFLKRKNDSSLFTLNLKTNITLYYFTLGTKQSLNYNYFKVLRKTKNTVYFFKKIMKYKDSYVFLKDSNYFFKKKKSVNFNEAKSYSEFLKAKFKKFKNLATLILPLDKNYFNLTINDEEFFNFYSRKMIKLEEENIDKNYLEVNYLRTFTFYDKNNENKLKIRPHLLVTEINVSDKIPIEYFLLVVLNIISFWFNLSLISILKNLKLFLKIILKIFYYLKFFFVY